MSNQKNNSIKKMPTLSQVSHVTVAQTPPSQNSKKASRQHLQALQAEWYCKLQASGFIDIEDNNHYLKKWDSYVYRVRHRDCSNSMIRFEQIRDYYRLASFFLNEYPFENELERFIWEKHAEGKYLIEIEELIKAQPHFRSLKKTQINVRIVKLRREMLRLYCDD